MNRNFQYPPSGSRRCNRAGILERFTMIVHFQYPPSGSRRCNSSADTAPVKKKELSVPSKRVETLQRCFTFSHLFTKCPFSTLQAGRDAATNCSPSSSLGV